MANASIAFNKDAVVADIKTTVDKQEKEIDELYRKLGKCTAELAWPAKKLKRKRRIL
ncbi:MAG: hypothetical protein P1U74_10790 [Legionellaceae bacterium]|nr:hypothetical protein [Legionellaceae bacterium]